MPEVVRVNNVIFSWNSLRLTIDGQPWTGLRGISFSQKRERKVVWGMRRDGTPLGKTSGKYSVEGMTIKFLRDSYNALTDYLTITGLGSYGDAQFTLTLEAIEESNFIPIIIVATNCTIDGEKSDDAEGAEELVDEIEVGALAITRNGKSLFSLLRSIG